MSLIVTFGTRPHNHLPGYLSTDYGTAYQGEDWIYGLQIGNIPLRHEQLGGVVVTICQQAGLLPPTLLWLSLLWGRHRKQPDLFPYSEDMGPDRIEVAGLAAFAALERWWEATEYVFPST